MVDLRTESYTRVYDILFGVAVFVMLAFFLLQVIGGMIRREPAALSRAALGMAKSILGSFVALALLTTALEITDRLSTGIVHAAGTSMDEMGGRIGLLAVGLSGLNIAAPGAGAVVTIFVAGLAISAAFLVWISLLIRKALLLVAIVFAPVALAGSSWYHTRQWASRWATFVIAMILSKLVIVVIFLLATAQVSAPIDADLQSVSEPIAGVVLMLVAGFAPYMAYKAISFMGFDTYHAVSAEQEVKSALNRPLPIPLNRLPATEPPKVLSAGDGAGSGSAQPTGSGPGPGPGLAPATSTAAGGAPGSASSGGAGGVAAGAGAGGAAAGGAASGGLVAGVAVAKQAATAGPKVGGAVRAAASGRSDAAASHAPPTDAPMSQVADPARLGAANGVPR